MWQKGADVEMGVLVSNVKTSAASAGLQDLDFRPFERGAQGKAAVPTWVTSQEHWRADLATQRPSF